MRRLLPLALLLSIPIVLSACGSGGKPSTVSQQVPAAGATVTLGDQVTLKIPPGALPDATKVTITRKNATGDALQGGQTLGSGYNIDLGGQTLAKPVTLEIAFDSKKLPQDSPAETAFAAYHDDTKNTWVPVGGTVDTQRNVIVVQTDHLSWWNPFSWNWGAWIAVLHDTLSGKINNWVSGLQLLTGTCSKSGQHVTVDDSKANSILQGCISTDDPASPQLRVVNVKSFYVGISPAQGGPGYPNAQVLGPGESAPFTASTADQPPATVYADFTDAAMWRFIVGLCAEMLPGGDQIPNEGLAFIADGLQRVESARAASDALDRGDARAAAESIYEIVTGNSFIETFAQLAMQYGQQHGIDMMTRWTQTGIHTALLGLASTDVIVSATDFLANYVFNNRSELSFGWTQSFSCPVSDKSLCVFARQAAAAASSKDMRWFADHVLSGPCPVPGDTQICSADPCIEVGLLGSEGGCIATSAFLADLDQQIGRGLYLFGIVKSPATAVFENNSVATDVGPALLFGGSDSGKMLIAQNKNGAWKITAAVNMSPATLFLYLRGGDISYWPDLSNVSGKWLSSSVYDFFRLLPTQTANYRIESEIGPADTFNIKITLYAILTNPNSRDRVCEYERQLKDYANQALDRIRSNDVNPADLNIDWQPRDPSSPILMNPPCS